MNLRALALLLCFGSSALSGCGGAAPLPQSPAGSSGNAETAAPAKTSPRVYWTLFASGSYPQVEFTNVPLTQQSTVTNVGSSSKNGLGYTSGMAVDAAGRLWILSYGDGGGTPTNALVFKLPLKATSVPLYTFVLSGTKAASALAFDPAGNLWVSSVTNHRFLKFAPPFKKSGTLKPAKAIKGGPFYSYSFTFDEKGTLYASIANSTGTDSIGVSKPPYGRKNSYFLNGLSSPGGVIFDRDGNLYASGTVASGNVAIVRYNSDDLKSGDKPSIVDPAGLQPNAYVAAFAFTAKGDLYTANCGAPGTVGIFVYPISKKKFGAKLAPSVYYSNSYINEAGCAWGLAIE